MIVSNRMARTARHPTPLRLDVTGRPVELRAIDLDTFFHPRTVAVVGASDTPGRPNTAMTRKIREWADKAGAALYPVNPNRTEVDGLPSVPSILDVPVDVDRNGMPDNGMDCTKVCGHVDVPTGGDMCCPPDLASGSADRSVGLLVAGVWVGPSVWARHRQPRPSESGPEADYDDGSGRLAP